MDFLDTLALKHAKARHHSGMALQWSHIITHCSSPYAIQSVLRQRTQDHCTRAPSSFDSPETVSVESSVIHLLAMFLSVGLYCYALQLQRPTKAKTSCSAQHIWLRFCPDLPQRTVLCLHLSKLSLTMFFYVPLRESMIRSAHNLKKESQQIHFSFRVNDTGRCSRNRDESKDFN